MSNHPLDIPPKKWGTVKALALIGLSFAGQTGAFVLVYYGRRRGVPFAGSDFILFVLPFLLAFFPYESAYNHLFLNRSRLPAIGASVLTGIVAMLVGMQIAFGQWGT